MTLCTTDKRDPSSFVVLAVAAALLCLFASRAFPAEEVEPLLRWGVPEGTATVHVKGHLISAYDGRARAPLWVLEHHTRHSFIGPAERRTVFHEDKRIPLEFRATLANYRGSGDLWDRGHMARCDNYKFNQAAMDATFCLSLVAPQNKRLNEVTWSALERYCQQRIADCDEGWILTMPIYRTVKGQISRFAILDGDGPWISLGFGKSLLVLEHGESEPGQIETWLMPNTSPPERWELDDYKRPVDLGESLSGLEWWGELPEPLQSSLEAAK